MSILEILKNRGFIENTTHDDELSQYLGTPGKSCYIGFDPTASSLHVGSLVPIMSLAHMQRAGHKPIALVGGGTGKVGDPSGKTEMRQMLSLEDIENNKKGLREQLSRYLDFSEGSAKLMDNNDWLKELKYIPFLRDYGRHFSVNRMIKAESYKTRIESDEGLSFLEFNYMIFQAYDFLELSRRSDCFLQMGGSDQWGNIVAGVELIRRASQKQAYGITFPLVTTSSGAKMGKTAKGAVWLDPERTSPYDFYQFWVNTDDADVVRFLSLFTFLPMGEISEVKDLKDSDLNSAKAILAYEATLLAHGKENADKALASAASMFGAKVIPDNILPSSTIIRQAKGGTGDNVPATEIEENRLKEGIPAFKLFFEIGLAQSGGAARKLLTQGGGYMHDERITPFDYEITTRDMKDNEIILRAGKKRYHKIILK